MNSKPFGVQSMAEVPARPRPLQVSLRFPASPTPPGSWGQYVAAHQRITMSCLILLSVLGVSTTVFAQKSKDSWSNLDRLKEGQGIQVVESNMKSHTGKFVSVSDESLSLREKGSDVSIKREDIVRVSTSSAPKRAEHTVIGLVAGAAVGLGIGAAAGSAHGFLGGSSRGITSLVGVVIGAPSGAVVGAIIPAHTTVYRAEPASSQPIKTP